MRRSKLQCFMLSNLQRKTSSVYLKLDARLARLAHRTCGDSGSNEYHKNPDEIRELLFLMTHYMCMLANETYRWKKYILTDFIIRPLDFGVGAALGNWRFGNTWKKKKIVTLIFCVFMEIKFFSTFYWHCRRPIHISSLSQPVRLLITLMLCVFFFRYSCQ